MSAKSMPAPLIAIDKIERSDLALETAARLAQLIAASEAGSRLPPEKDLCRQLGVGRSTLREAIRSLALLGAVQPRQGSGTYVSILEDQAAEKLIALALSLQRSKVHEIIEVRRTLEVEAARLAAEHHDSDDRGELESIMGRMEAAASRPEEASVCDLEFHVRLAKASHNQVLMHFIGGMRSLLGFWMGRAVNQEEVVRDIIREHNDVLRAVSNRQGDRAAASMFLHQTNAAERLFAVVGRDHSTAEYIPLLLARQVEVTR